MPSILPTEENMTENEANGMQVESIDVEERCHTDKENDIIKNMIERVAINKDAYFKSQQKDEEDLSLDQKRQIAIEILNGSKSNFLRRFGKYLKPEDLEYFNKFIDDDNDGYEISFFLRQLNQCSENGQKEVKNRRFEAMKQMFNNSTYFSETEMMKRNPLLYEQLVGQYLTDDEKFERDKNDSQNDTLVNILLSGIDKDEVNDRKQKQQEQEDDVMEEEEDSDDDGDNDDASNHSSKTSDNSKPSTSFLWGAFESDKNNVVERKHKNTNRKDSKWYLINDQEKQLLREEFFSNMYQNFLEGNDTEFDYTTVDFNADYDCTEFKNQDEEDKYFDSESPEDTQMDVTSAVKPVESENTSEDELDIYMKHLNQNPTVCQLTRELQNM